MARKFCPACNKLNAGSATRCSCGLEFAVSTIVEAQRTTKRCPGCRRPQPLLLEVCGCGHEFGDIREHREFLEERVRIGWSYVALGATLAAICTAVMIATSWVWIAGAFLSAMLAFKGFATRADARLQLRSVRSAAGMLPSAKVLR